MNTKLTARQYFGVAIVVLLLGCTPVSVQPTKTSAPPKFTPSTTLETSSPTPFSTPLPGLLPRFPLSGYVMIFVKDGDLYFQDGNNLPVKLTHVGEKSYYPKLSDDNRKVVFSRDDGNEYSINTDGTQEQIIIRNDWLASFEAGTNKSILGFVSATHQLLVETYFCESQKFESPCSTSLFLANTDTGTMEKLVDLGLALQQNSISRNIEVSPDGKMVAFGTMQGVGIITIEGKIVRNNILPYKPSTSTVLFPFLYWLPDSNGLIVALPNTIYHSTAYGDFPAYTVWRYRIDKNDATQILLDSPLRGIGIGDFDISPDGNWGIYGGIGEADSSLYIGNLTNGHTQIFGHDIQPSFSWSPDSTHFIYTSNNSVLGTIDQQFILIKNCGFIQWIDAGHFTCNVGSIRMAEIDAGGEVKLYDLGFGKDVEDTLLIKPK